MITSDYSDLLNRQVSRRFNYLSNQDNEHIEAIEFDRDFYVDLLRIFNNPEAFDPTEFSNYPLEAILLYLRKTHELYRNKSLQDISLAIERLDRTNETLTKLKLTLQSFFMKFKSDLEAHLALEEEYLFPYVEAMIGAEKNKPIDTIDQTVIAEFMDHHDDHLESDMRNLVMVLNAFSDKYEDSFSFRMLLNRLTVFELDLRIHGKIEDEVLIPKAKELEVKLSNLKG